MGDLVNKIQSFLQRLIGVNKLKMKIYKQEDAISSLHYFVSNYCVDPRQIKETEDPELRIMQKCDALLLKIIDKVCKKHNIQYWLDFGTLIGACRHNGVIPWDDDLDISMLRNDYFRFIDCFKKEIKDPDFEIGYYCDEPLKSIYVGYRHSETGIWCDIFPYDVFSYNSDFKNAVVNIKNSNLYWLKYYHKEKRGKDVFLLFEEKKQIFNKPGNNVIYTPGLEFPHKHPNAFFKPEEIFPLDTHEFEGGLYPVPQNAERFLDKCISPSWPKIPLYGVLHHGEAQGRAPLSKWASINGVDMNEVKRKLEEISNSILL